MNEPVAPAKPRRKGIYLLPNLFTTGTLFGAFYAIVSSMNGNFDQAAIGILFAMVADALDGRIARMTNTSTDFGKEYDSLCDMAAFGIASSIVVYAYSLRFLSDYQWLGGKLGGVLAMTYATCAALRLARFNVEQAGTKNTHFTGLPSPAAGMTLATYYWFSQTPLYTETMIGDLPWHQMLRWVMLGLGMLMISNVQYAKVPTVNFRTLNGILGFLLVVGTFVGVIFLPKKFFFPALMAYVLYGIGRTVFLGLLDRIPGAREDDDATEDDLEEPIDPRRRRRRRRPSRQNIAPDAGREEPLA